MYEHLESKETYREFYEQQGKQGYSNQHITEDWARIKPHIPYYKDAIVFEAGLQGGGVTKIIAKYAKEVLSCDVSDSYLLKAKEYLKDCDNVILRRGFAENILGEFEDKFDVVVLGEILEHVQDDKLLIEKAIKALNFDGVILVSVPYHLADPLGEHVRNYEQEDLIRLFHSFEEVDSCRFELISPWIIGEVFIKKEV